MKTKKHDLPNEVMRLLPLTPAVFFILFALADGDKHGYAIMQETTKLSEGRFRMGPGTLYTTIQRLLDLSLIEEVWDAIDGDKRESRRRYYRLTRQGRALLDMEINRMGAVLRLASEKRLWPQVAK
jgi:DNA-binding PadR family transcriptional regulator